MATNRVLQLLRSSNVYATITAAKSAVNDMTGADGEIRIARYTGKDEHDNDVTKSLLCVYHASPSLPNGTTAGWTFIEDAQSGADGIDALQTELDNLEAQVGQDGATTTFASGATSGSDAEQVLKGAQTGGTAPTNLTNAVTNVATYIGTLDKDASAIDGKVVTTISQANGQVDETKADLSDVKMGGYSKTSDTGAIAATDTLKVAVSKLENAIAANAVVSEDGSIDVNTGTNGDTNIQVNVDGTTIVKDSSTGELSTALKVIKVIPSGTAGTNEVVDATLSSNVKEAYRLVYEGSITAIGKQIEVYKDSSLKSVQLGNPEDTIDANGDIVTAQSPAAETAGQSLNFVYHLADGTYQLVQVDVSRFLTDSEYGNGLTVTNHIISVLIDPNSEKDSQDSPVDFLTVSSTGVKVQGIKAEIERNINALDGTATASTVAAGTDTTPTGDFCVLTKVGEENGVVKEVAASGTYASKSVLLKKVAATGAAEDVTIADSGNLITATTVEGALQEIAQDIDNNHIVSNDVIVATTDTTNHQTTLSVTTGNGLEKVDTDSDSVADTLKVKQGSGITVDNNGVSVNAGDGLVIDSTTNDLNVNTGNGIEIASDAVKVKIAQHQTDSKTGNALDANDMFTLTSAGLGLSNVWDCGTY